MRDWKSIPDHEGVYEIDSGGNIRNLNTGRELRPYLNAGGYREVTLGRKSWRVHRLVLLAFVGPSELGVRHLDGDKLNNKLSNLAYGTQRENVHDSMRHGTFKPVVGSRKLKEFCVNGHRIEETPWAGKNRRLCLTCKRATARAWAAAKRASSRTG